MRSQYKSINQFGSNLYSPVNNPLTYSFSTNLESEFLHGSSGYLYGKDSKHSQLFLAQHCADNWDAFCEARSLDNVKQNNVVNQNCMNDFCKREDLTPGEMLIYNTASRKYLVKMFNCEQKHELFDPLVPTSPLISYWVPSAHNHSQTCIPIYKVNSENINSDPVMNKILNKPTIAMDILVNIYNSMKRDNELSKLEGTRLGNFYSTQPYFKDKGGLGN
jgi:hypothetical protein